MELTVPKEPAFEDRIKAGEACFRQGGQLAHELAFPSFAWFDLQSWPYFFWQLRCYFPKRPYLKQGALQGA